MVGNGDHIQVLMLLKYIKKSVDIVVNTKSFISGRAKGHLLEWICKSQTLPHFTIGESIVSPA